jgi:iron complex outermembrane receptor protein
MRPWFVALLLSTLSPLAAAEEAAEAASLGEVVVTAPLGRTVDEIARPATVLSEEDLRLKLGGTLGETLAREPGVTSASFGPGVGQPVIRGQSGPRVRVMQDGIGTLDVSTISPDHANSVEPLLADRIEVLRGPATLLHGSGLIGGAVNVIDNRVPDRIPEHGLGGAAEQRYDSVADEKAGVFKLDVGQEVFALHLDGYYRDSGDVDIPGRAIDERAEAASHGAGDDEDHGGDSFNTQGYIANSGVQAQGGTAGFSFVGERGFFGFAANRIESDYGIPPGAHSHGPDHGEAEARGTETGGAGFDRVGIQLRQSRYDFKGELNDPLPGFESLRVRAGYTDYRHVERENGQKGTTFTQDGVDSRLELTHQPFGPLKGVLGFQARSSEFAAVGEEAVVPRSDIESFGGFAVESIAHGPLTYDLGLRLEQQTITPEGLKGRSHTPISASASALWAIDAANELTFAVTRSQRAPQVQELYSDGIHAATRSYELGDPNLAEETSYNLDLTYRLRADWMRAELSVFHNWVNDYLFQRYTGAFFNREAEAIEAACSEPDACVPVLQSAQQDAIFQGFEANLTFPLFDRPFGALDLSLFGDYTRGYFDRGGDVPRMPPLRYGLQLDYARDAFSATLRLTRAEAQEHPGANETRTDGYVRLDLGVNYRVRAWDRAELLLFAKGNNLLDEEIRNSTSYLRNLAPEPGRGAEVGLRVSF